ncbi:MAG: hypothetical protein JOZ05_14350 [Acetobacteraceae bacterium]|nr:hypothetical protein [Acetobacteraceae bacterium]
MLEANGDATNAAHAGYLQARGLLLIGRLDDAERDLDALNVRASTCLEGRLLAGRGRAGDAARSGRTGAHRARPGPAHRA